MLALKIAGGMIAVLFLLLLVPVGLRVTFDGALAVRLRVLFLSFSLYPWPPQSEKKARKQAEKQAKKTKKEEEAAKEKKELSHAEQMLREDGVAAVLSYYAELARLAGTAAKRLLRTITVDKLKLHIRVASEDAAQTAINYGRVCAGIYPAQAVVENVLRVRRRSIQIQPDFMREQGAVEGEIRLHVLPVRVLWAGLLFFIAYLGNTNK